MAKLDQLLQQVRTTLGAEFVSTDIFGMDGLSIAGISVDPNFNGSEAAARFTMVMKLGTKVSNQLNLGTVDDNLVTTDQAYVLSRFLGNGSYVWGLAVTREATLGSVRLLMNEYADQLWDAIPNK